MQDSTQLIKAYGPLRNVEMQVCKYFWIWGRLCNKWSRLPDTWILHAAPFTLVHIWLSPGIFGRDLELVRQHRPGNKMQCAIPNSSMLARAPMSRNLTKIDKKPLLKIPGRSFAAKALRPPSNRPLSCSVLTSGKRCCLPFWFSHLAVIKAAPLSPEPAIYC